MIWLNGTSEFPPRCKRDLPSSGMLCSVHWYRRFGTNYRSHIQGASNLLWFTLVDGTGSFSRNVWTCQWALRNIREEGRPYMQKRFNLQVCTLTEHPNKTKWLFTFGNTANKMHNLDIQKPLNRKLNREFRNVIEHYRRCDSALQDARSCRDSNWTRDGAVTTSPVQHNIAPQAWAIFTGHGHFFFPRPES